MSDTYSRARAVMTELADTEASDAEHRAQWAKRQGEAKSAEGFERFATAYTELARQIRGLTEATPLLPPEPIPGQLDGVTEAGWAG